MNTLCPSSIHHEQDYDIDIKQALEAEEATLAEQAYREETAYFNEWNSWREEEASNDYPHGCAEKTLERQYGMEYQDPTHPVYESEDEDAAYSMDTHEDNDALLSLVVGVQSYLSDTDSNPSYHVPPLLNLQYKMYIYLKQRVLEMGYDTQGHF